ncbi:MULTISPECIES: hypothetical protein [unclassified Acidiphilium]|jgi:hypothetical protein|uniref:hypothetical protein n=1 Tax=unclassified Acidiphilium TaxID=2617493 RepID=UPI001F382C5E|nr:MULTISPECIES: hypothetical protein [unclassified Acidiphilium]HQT61439.1 hypothetical protein [Acidiphilium sp.]HQT73520.1 hypothetical protein [Acidiphilium sp.]
MTDARPGDKHKAEPPDAETRLADLARDWITLWQSELAAMAQDREWREAWTGLMTIWAGAATAAIGAAEAMSRHEPPRRPRPDGTARPAPPAAAPDAGGDAVERLHRRIAELEARLAALERDGGPGGP